MKKKIIGLIFAALCVFACVTVTAKSYNIKENTDRYKLLVGLGITDETENLESTVKNSEFTAAVKRLFGDNTDSYELKNFENKLNSMELNPDEALNINTAAQVAVTALGYDVIINNSQYLSTANSKGLLKGTGNKSELTYSDMVSILYNMLEEPMCKVEYINGLTRNDNTFLNDFLKIKKTTGLVTAVKGQTLSGTGVGLDNRIAINSQVYNTESIDNADYFARNVICYYRENDGVNTVVYLYTDKENEENIDVTMITEVSFSNGKYTIKYEDLREKKYKAEITPKYVSYNGEKLSLDNVDMKTLLDFDYGNVILIDSDDDGKYDILIIESYENYHVSFVGRDVIYDKNGKTALNLDFDNPEYTYEFIKDGKAAQYSDIAQNNVLSVYKSTNGTYVKIYISDKTASGVIETKEYTENGCKLIIGGFPYYTSLDSDKLSPGDNTVFYLDVNGIVAGYDITNLIRNTEYGYIVKLYKDEVDIIHARIFSKADSKLIELKSKDEKLNVEYEGVSKKMTYDEIKPMFDDENGNFAPQCVQFSSNGIYITKLVAAADKQEGKIYFQKASEGNNVYGKDRIASCAIDSTGKKTWILAVPPEDEMNNSSKYTVNYSLVTGTKYDYELYDTDEFYMAKVLVIRMKTTDRVTNTNAIDRGIRLSVVKNISAVYEWNDSKGEVDKYWQVTLGTDGKIQTYKVISSEMGLYVGEQCTDSGNVKIDVAPNGTKICVDTRNGDFLSKGDVIQTYVENGQLIAVRRWYRAATNTVPSNNSYMVPGYCTSAHGTSVHIDEGFFAYGNVKKLSNDYLVVDMSNPDMDPQYGHYKYMTTSVYPMTCKDTQGYIYHRATGEVELADKSDIKEGDDIVFQFAYYEFRSFVVFR